jgi:1,4-alpha-glucan branching enzyme
VQPKGYLSLVLHSHLPFVKHPEHDYFLEEHWLFEAIIESYLPLLMNLNALKDEGISFCLSVSLTPTLCEMLSDDHLMEKFDRHLDKLIELAGKECARLEGDDSLHTVARFYDGRLRQLRDFFHARLERSVLGGYRALSESGHLEILTCGATHGFLPLLSPTPKAIEVQLNLAVRTHQKHFGCTPKGIWLPECAYYEGLDEQLSAAGIEFFFLESHGLAYARPTPRYGLYAPIFTPKGVAAFARDPESSRQVWSSIVGYPGDENYRDFYRDIGYEREMEYIAPYICPDGTRVFTGLKYHRVTGEGEDKGIYHPDRAAEKAQEHAYNFVFNREKQIEHLSHYMDRPPLITSPYDAELFGHWWFEGPIFLYHLFKALSQSAHVEAITPSRYLDRHPTNQMVHPSPSSWGKNGYYEVWLNHENDWIYRHLHRMADRLCELACQHKEEPDALKRRLLSQMSRELLLAQSSDWAFLITTATATHYATKRTKEHISHFLRLEQMLEEGIDEGFLGWLEERHSLFEGESYTLWC